MGKATRIEHRWNLHTFDLDDATIIARYKVEGHEDHLFVRTYWSGPADTEEERQAIEPSLLRMADEEAEWAAEHPDDVPTAELVCL